MIRSIPLPQLDNLICDCFLLGIEIPKPCCPTNASFICDFACRYFLDRLFLDQLDDRVCHTLFQKFSNFFISAHK